MSTPAFIQSSTFLVCPRRVRGLVFRVVPALVVLLTIAGPRPVHAQASFTWTQHIPTTPFSRIENTLVYDSVTGREIMFGGYDLNWNRVNDIWEYNGGSASWTEVTPATGALPARRSGHAAAFDPVRRRMIVFGGLNENLQYLGDTWEWDSVNKTWSNVTPSSSPSPRQGSRMVYDAANDRLVLVGGVDANYFYSETWAWNLTSRSWTKLSTGASSSAGRSFVGRTFAGLAYNSSTNRVVVFGGIGYPAGGGAVADFNDLWELRGSTWTDVTPGVSPPGRGWTQLVYDAVNNRMVIFGGWSDVAGSSYGDTWALSGGAWTQIVPQASGPGIRDSHGMVWDAARQRVVVFGGYFPDVIELVGNTWTIAYQGDHAPGEDQHSMVYDTDRAMMVMYGGGSWETWELSPATGGWARYFVPGPGGRTGGSAVYQRSRRSVLVFGGRQKSITGVGAKLADTWEWNTSAHTWTNVTPGTSPAARDDHAMAFDEARSRVVLFGGRDANGNALGDTWLWNGSSWSYAGGGPSARFGASMAYDAARGVVVLFGGDNGSQRLSDLWEWNGSSWRQISASGPSARAYASMAFLSSQNGGVLLFGGVNGSTLMNDSWIWNGSSWTKASPSVAPTPRQRAALVYDSQNNRLLLYGGRDANGISAQLWIASGFVAAVSQTRRDGDFDGDGKSDPTVYRPSTGHWWVLRSNANYGGYTDIGWGIPGDVPVSADYDGDGRADVAIYRPSDGSWWILKSSTSFSTYMAYTWGVPGDRPYPADYDGDGKADPAIYRPSTGHWWVLRSSTNYSGYWDIGWGLVGDVPAPGDYDGDGRADLGVYRPSTGYWHILTSTTGYSYAAYSSFWWGYPEDVPVQADFDGDGRTDIAVYRPSTGVWWWLKSSTGFTGYGSRWWGQVGDVPIVGDLDGDGRADLSIYRPSSGYWWMTGSSTGYSAYTAIWWGMTGDVPIMKR